MLDTTVEFNPILSTYLEIGSNILKFFSGSENENGDPEVVKVFQFLHANDTKSQSLICVITKY